MSRFHLVRIDPENNTRRFYAARVQATLFGTFALVREWGRIGSPGRMQSEEHGSHRAPLRSRWMRSISLSY